LTYVCPRCVLNDAEEIEKYPWQIKRGKVRPILLHITLTILLCPRCKTQYLSKDFFLEELTEPLNIS